MGPEIFMNFCSVCDKQMSSSFDIYCSEACRHSDSVHSRVFASHETTKSAIKVDHIHGHHSHNHHHHNCKSDKFGKTTHSGSCPLYPSVLDYYMDDRRRTGTAISPPESPEGQLAPELSDASDEETMSDFSLPPSPRYSIVPGSARHSAQVYQLAFAA